jgi:hypothetical protein
MSLFSSFFQRLGALIKGALGEAVIKGLTDDLIQIALGAVRFAASQFTDNAERREYVVNFLKSRGVPESIARLAVELAVQLYKKEVEPRLS